MNSEYNGNGNNFDSKQNFILRIIIIQLIRETK